MQAQPLPSIPSADTSRCARIVADIIAHCRVHLAAYKVPRHVVFGEVPKTSTGKIQKFVLRERAKAV